jgi:hypothetical protein
MTVRPPAHVEPYVRVLGQDLAIRFLLELGGARRLFSASPRPDNMVCRVVGQDLARALYDEFGMEAARVPTPKEWIGRVWAADGVSVSEIARRLHVNDTTVRRWLSPQNADARAAAEERRARKAAEKARRDRDKSRQIDLIDWLANR